MNPFHTLGKNIRAIRYRKALSQEMLADKARIKLVTLRNIETGKRKPRFQTLHKIAQALDVTPEELTTLPWPTNAQVSEHDRDTFSAEEKHHPSSEGDEPSPPNELDEYVPHIRKALLYHDVMACGLQEAGQADRLPTLKEIRSAVDAAYRLRQAAWYVELGTAVPNLLITAQQATWTYRDEQQRIAFGLLAEANHVAAAFLKKAGRHDLAWVAVDRGILAAEQSESVLLRASSAYRLANLMLSIGQFQEAADITTRSINLLEADVGAGSAPHLSMWGALLLKRSVIAARRGDATTAWECIGEARATARRLGADRNDFWTAFGPTNVVIHEVSVATELGEWDRAIRRAQTVKLEGLSKQLLERRARLLVDTARCFAERRLNDKALHTLLEADRIAPEDVRHSRAARALMTKLAVRERRGVAMPGLRELIMRSGVPV